jgi:prepilin-type processing-associated H-X9-DG protein
MKIEVMLTKTDIGVLVICIMFLAGTLGMIGSKGRERAKRTLCEYHVREHLEGLIASALDNDGSMPLPRHSGRWLWDIDVDVVNQMLDHGLRKETFYCPSNPTTEKYTDIYWTFNGQWDSNRFVVDSSGYVISGYCYVLELRSRNQPRGIGRPGIMGSGNKQWVTSLDMPNASNMELVVDATLCQDTSETESGRTFGEVVGGIYARWGVYDRTNHLKDVEKPWGGTIGFLDGHVSWRPFEEMEVRYRTPEFWW